jgi:hypothetical protein
VQKLHNINGHGESNKNPEYNSFDISINLVRIHIIGPLPELCAQTLVFLNLNLKFRTNHVLLPEEDSGNQTDNP